MDEELAKTEITSLYKKILGRIPDNDGLESYTKQLRSGKMTLDGVEVNEEGLRPIAQDISNGKRNIIETQIIEE